MWQLSATLHLWLSLHVSTVSSLRLLSGACTVLISSRNESRRADWFLVLSMYCTWVFLILVSSLKTWEHTRPCSTGPCVPWMAEVCALTVELAELSRGSGRNPQNRHLINHPSRAATDDYFHSQLILWSFFWLIDSSFSLKNVINNSKCHQKLPESKVMSYMYLLYLTSSQEKLKYSFYNDPWSKHLNFWSIKQQMFGICTW